MNKSELIDAVASIAELSKTTAQRALDALIDTITDTLKQRKSVTLVGFGTFDTIDRSGRKGRNPQTGAEIDIQPKTVPVFKAGKSLKDAVDGDKKDKK